MKGHVFWRPASPPATTRRRRPQQTDCGAVQLGTAARAIRHGLSGNGVPAAPGIQPARQRLGGYAVYCDDPCECGQRDPGGGVGGAVHGVCDEGEGGAVVDSAQFLAEEIDPVGVHDVGDRGVYQDVQAHRRCAVRADLNFLCQLVSVVGLACGPEGVHSGPCGGGQGGVGVAGKLGCGHWPGDFAVHIASPPAVMHRTAWLAGRRRHGSGSVGSAARRAVRRSWSRGRGGSWPSRGSLGWPGGWKHS